MKNAMKNKLVALLLAVCTVFGLCVPAQAASIADGSKTCTVALGDRSNILETTAGTILRAGDYTYTTNDGLSGPAYCIDHGLAYTDKVLPITGKYTASPATAGAFANGYPQHSIDTFLGLHLADNAILTGLTEAEYAYATQVAVWATLGQVGVDGTKFTSGREYLNPPSGDTQQARVFRAVQLILGFAENWDRVYQTGMSIRLPEKEDTGNLAIDPDMTLEFAAAEGEFGIKREVINGVSYYTKEYIFASATSTYYNDYSMELWATNCPAGTIFTDLDNKELPRSNWRETATWRVPTTLNNTTLNSNGFEYSARAKLCIPVDTATPRGEITLHCAAQIMQYEIYLANNEEYSEQSYIIADPSKGTLEADAVLSWGGDVTEHGSLEIKKVSGGGIPLADAVFDLDGTDGSHRTGTTNEQGIIRWDMLDPHITYTLTEKTPPAGYGIVDPITVTVTAAHTTYETVRDDPLRTLTVKKVDKQSGYSLRGAVYAFEQIDGDYKTTATTDHAGLIQFDADRLPIGSYKVYEVVAPEGYELDSTVQTVHWDGKRDVTLTFSDVRKTTLILSKKDSRTGYNLPEASFAVYRDGTLIATVTTNDNGLAYVSDVKAGYYEIREVSAPAGYLLNTNTYGINIDPYDPATTDDPRLVIEDDPMPSLKIIKYDRDTGKPLDGVTFKVYRNATLYGAYTTDKAGEINLTGLEPGTYAVEEVNAGAYVADAAPQQIELEAGRTEQATLIFFNSPKPGIHVRKVDADTLKPLAGGTFLISQVDGGYRKELPTDENGEIDLTGLEPGTYTVQETVAPAGYLLDNSVRTIQIKAGQNAEFVFSDSKKPGLTLTKRDASGSPMAGVTFSLTPAGDGAHSDERATNAQGIITWDSLDPGIYSLVEVATLDGYVLDSTEHHVRLYTGRDGSVVLTNLEKPSLRLVKYDRTSHSPMTGVTFEIFKDTISIGKFQTDENGAILLDHIDPGTYKAVEVDAGDDSHILTTTPQEVELHAGDGVRELVFINDLLPGVHLVKVDSADLSTPIANAKFRFEAVDGDYGPVEYATAADGTIDLSKLPVGAYVVTELACPGYVVDDAQRIIQLQPNATAQFVFTNSKLPNLVLTKTGTDGKPLAGVVYSLTRIEDGTRYQDRATGAEGTITWETLTPGIYSLKEVATLDDYILDKKEYHVTVTAGENAEIKLTNLEKPSLRLVKYDRTSHSPMSGVTFEIFKDTISIGKFQTDENGAILLDHIDPGTYKAVEVDAGDDGYILTTTPQEVELRAGDGVRELVYFNDRLPGLHLIKVDSADLSTPIPNAKFRFVSVKGDFGPVEYTTMADGTIDLSKLPTGAYVVTELECAGYVIDDAQRIIHLDGNETAQFVFTNSKLPSLTLTKTSADGTPLAGVTFRIAYVEDGTHYMDKTTDQNGQIILDGLEPGVLSIVETATLPDHILDPTEHHVELTAGQTATIALTNDRRPNLTIHKVDADTDEPVAGAVFVVTQPDGHSVAEVTTGQDGSVTVLNLLPGAYIITEQSVPAPYLLDAPAQTVTLYANYDRDVTFSNHKKPSLTVNKVDSITGDPLQGVKFSVVYASNNTSTGEVNDLGTYTTDANGQFWLDKLQDGWYKVTELAPKSGYAIKDSAVQECYIQSGTSKELTFENSPLSALVVWKYDSVTGLAVQGATFQIRYLAGTSGTGGTVIGTYKTSANGSFTVTGLEAGAYIVEELASDSGHVIDTAPQTVYISGEDQDVAQIYFGNSPKGNLTVKKMDSVTHAPLSDVEFLVTLADGSLVGDANGKFVTDSAGSFTISGIDPGTTLVVKETRAKSGYLLDDTPQTAQIKAGQTVTLEFRNQPKGNLIIRKLDSVSREPLEGVEFKITYADGKVVDAAGGKLSSNGIYYTDKNGQIVLSGITGTLVATETKTISGYTIDENTRSQTVVVNPDDTQTLTFYNTPVGGVEIIKVSTEDKTERIPGVTFDVRKMDGALVDTVTTDKRGRAYLTLEDGSYYAVEIEAAEGYKLDNTPHYFTVKDGKRTTLTVINQPYSGIVIHKTDSVTGEGIYGVKFLVYDANKNPIGEYTSDNEGYVYIDDLTTTGKGKLFIRELEAAAGYELDKEYKTVYVQPGQTVEIDWKNTPITGQIQITKYAAEYNEVTGTAAGSPLQGAVYEIVDYRSGKVVDYITTDARGVAASKPLPLTRYQVREVTAPAYWQVDGTVHDVTLEYSGQIIKLSAYDKPAKLGVSITKRGNAEVLAGSQMRYDITVANTSNVALENFYWHDRIPNDGASATLLTTGTYSARLNYRVLYKTNYSDYRVLASNLLTTNNYSFSLSAIPLQSGEVITDVYFDFGKVPVGFQSKINPTLTVTVKGNAVNGYQLVNRADAGGKYQGTWQTANASWVTIIRNYTKPTPLPKTGY